MKKRIFSFVSLVLAFIMSFGIFSFFGKSSNNVSFANTENNVPLDKKIRFGEDGKLKILHVTDTHLVHDSNRDKTYYVVREACDREKPDLAVITGDIVMNYEDPTMTKDLIDGLMNIFQSRGIPVAVTFGNHDSEEGAMSREDIMAYYNTYSCSISVDDGEAISGCGTYNIPIYSSSGDKVAFNVWVFDSNDYDEEKRYSGVKKDQIAWYKSTSDALKEANGGEKVNSLVFQHIIVPEIYDALEKVKTPTFFTFKHLYNEKEYYRFAKDGDNRGKINEKPCPGYYNYGQFDALVEKGDVLAMFFGHDHTNAFSVKHKGIDIVNSPATRYRNNPYATQYGYRIVEVDEKDTTTYTTRVERLYDVFTMDYAKELKAQGDEYGHKLARKIAIDGWFQKVADDIYVAIAEFFTGRTVRYDD